MLTILCFPREYILIKNSIIKELDKISFMEIREKFINKEAKEYLASLAKDNNINTDNMLLIKYSLIKNIFKLHLILYLMNGMTTI